MQAVALALVLAAAAPDLSPASRIDAVTVFRQSARITRAARFDVPDGPARVLLRGLPDELDDDSIRVEGKGSARARVYGVTVERVTGEEAPATEARQAELLLERLQDEDRALEDRLRAAQARAKFVESLRSTYSEERAKNLAVRGVSSREWAELASFVEGELSRSAAETRKAEVGRREVARRVAQARAELDKLQAKRGRTTKTVAIEVEADQAGALDLRVSYGVPSAGWTPIWDARLLPEVSKVELAFLGSVWQRTGEDWSGVTLAVSTAQPARGLYVPELQPQWLQRFEPPSFGYEKRARASVPSAAPAAPMARQEADGDDEGLLGAVSVESVQASVTQGLLAATFTAPRRETVDGSGQARKIGLARFPLQAELVRTSAPRLEAAAYLTAKATNDTGFPLLAGDAGVYVGDQFAGRAPLAFTPAGGELELALGADERVEIERKVIERRRESAGVISKDEVIRYRTRITLKNRYATPLAVKLLDLVPASRDEKIQVKVLEGSTAPTREDPDRPGVRVHELQLGAREEKVIELRYEVRYPRGYPITGLD
jgi:uncharacterized protein (TIGR02231 family)